MTGRRGRVLVPSLAAGLLLALSLPPFGWWPLGPVGAGIAFWRLAGLRARRRLWAGWLMGLACYGVGLAWANAFNWYGAVVLVAVEALTMAVAAALVPPVRGRLPCFVGAFTLMEALRMRWPFGGLPMGGVFLGQADGPLLGTARLGGPLLLTALVWATGAAGALVVGALARGPRGRTGRPGGGGPGGGVGGPTAGAGPPGRLLLAGAVTLALVVALAGGAAYAPDGGGAVGSVRVAAVQGGGRRGLDKAQVDPATVLAAQERASARLDPGLRSPQLVVWPEDVLSVVVPFDGSPQSLVPARLAQRLHATVLAGVTDHGVGDPVP